MRDAAIGFKGSELTFSAARNVPKLYRFRHRQKGPFGGQRYIPSALYGFCHPKPDLGLCARRFGGAVSGTPPRNNPPGHDLACGATPVRYAARRSQKDCRTAVALAMPSPLIPSSLAARLRGNRGLSAIRGLRVRRPARKGPSPLPQRKPVT